MTEVTPKWPLARGPGLGRADGRALDPFAAPDFHVEPRNAATAASLGAVTVEVPSAG